MLLRSRIECVLRSSRPTKTRWIACISRLNLWSNRTRLESSESIFSLGPGKPALHSGHQSEHYIAASPNAQWLHHYAWTPSYIWCTNTGTQHAHFLKCYSNLVSMVFQYDYISIRHTSKRASPLSVVPEVLPTHTPKRKNDRSISEFDDEFFFLEKFMSTRSCPRKTEKMLPAHMFFWQMCIWMRKDLVR